MPECKACHIDKDVEDFSVDRRKKNGCQSYCKACAAGKVLAARKRNPTPHREAMARYDKRNPQRHLKRRVGITFSEKMDRFEAQGRKCAACGSTEHNHPRLNGENGWCADHSHITDQFRGVVCWPCNMALGFADDSIKRLTGLVQYLNAANAAINTLIVGAGYAHERETVNV